MKFTIEEEQQIDKAAEFLIQKGYQKTYWEDQIIYEKGQVRFGLTPVKLIGVCKYDIYIKFEVEGKGFFVLSELAYVRKGLKLPEDKCFRNILLLLQYIQENYYDLMNIEYCRESYKMVDKLLEDTVDKAAGFLLKKRYKKERWENSIDYENRKMRFSMSIRYHRDEPDIWIHFKKENESFSARWLALVRKGIKLPNNVEGIYIVLALLKYIQEDYDNLKNIEYCRESDKLISSYLDRLFEEKIDKAAYFLVQKGYQKVKTEDSIIYKNGNVEFIAYLGRGIHNKPNKSVNDIDIKFVVENESYYMWTIADTRRNIRKKYEYEAYENGSALLRYIQEDYDNLIDIEYCRESLRMKKEADEKAEK